MNSDYIIRRAESSDDGRKLHDLFAAVFHPEDVGGLAETIFNCFPRMEKRYWFMAEERETSKLVSGFALIPWTWEIEGVRLEVAEMGIVGTLEEHRRRGLMRTLNQEFDRTLEEEKFDLAIIQGIPGFYYQFGFHYALPLENHINMPLHLIPEEKEEEACNFRPASEADIPYLLQEDESYRASFSISAFRDKASWRYLLTDSLKTGYGSEYWVMERRDREEKFYCRIPREGFGKGLIISEISDGIDHGALARLLAFCRQLAVERDKPYLRLNLHNDSNPGRMAIAMGAEKGKPYAWQVKFPDVAAFLEKTAPVLEKRIAESSFSGFSGGFRLDFFKTKIDLVWSDGRLESIRPGEGDCKEGLSISADLFPALCLGHRTWQELRYIRPDVFPKSGMSALLIEALFPPCKSWIHQQY